MNLTPHISTKKDQVTISYCLYDSGTTFINRP